MTTRSAQVGVVDGLVSELYDAVVDRYDVVRVAGGDLRTCGTAAGGVTALVTSSKTGASPELLDELPNLRALVNFGVGVERLDHAYLTGRGIKVANTPDVTADCVADLAVGSLIAVRRRIAEADRFVRSGQWRTSFFGTSRRITGMRVGIAGLGRIGSRVAKRLSGFNAEIRYHNRRPVTGATVPYEGSLAALAEWADALIVTVPASRETERLIDADVLRAIGDGVLVNVSRGSVVDEEALVAALRDGQLGGAALDVFEREPDVPAELLALDNVVLTPHIGSATEETRADMVGLVLANLSSFLGTGVLLTPAW